MQHSALRLAGALGALVLIGLGLASGGDPNLSPGAVLAQQAPFTCTEVIGFSQTDQWYEGVNGQGGFINAMPNPGNWQLRWFSGGSIDQWAAGGGNYRAGGFPGWGSQYLVTHCAQNSNSPDRVVLQVSGNFNNDPNWWANQTAQAIANIRSYAPNERSILIMPVIGGPNGGPCYDSNGSIVRATYNYPYINQGLGMDVAQEVTLGPQATVRTCADYADNVGHLTPDAAHAVGNNIAQWTLSHDGSGGGNNTQPTTTPTPPAGATSTPTKTPAPLPPPPGANGLQTITFDDLSNPNRPLNGQYPSGLIDWGQNLWWLAGPYGKFTTQSISFNGPGATTATFTFVSRRRPVQVDVYNGGNSSSLVTLFCDGALMNQVSLPAGQQTTLVSGMSGTCGMVTLGSDNGWNTNFDNLMVDLGAPATATPTALPTNSPTATPQAASTSAPTARPTSPASSQGQTVVTFDDLSNSNRPLTGNYGGANWGNGAWWLSGPYAQFNGNSVSFNGAGPTSASISLSTPLRLIQLDVDDGGKATTTITLSCPSQPTVQTAVSPGHVVTVATNWSGTCSSITFGSSNGWDTNFKNLVFAASSAAPAATPTATATPTRIPITIAFDDLSGIGRPLNGQYPAGIVDWGTNGWYLSGPYASDNTNSVSFNGAGPTSSGFGLMTPRIVASVDVINGGGAASTVTIACGGQTAGVQVSAGQRVTLTTGWMSTCTGGVVFTSSNGWNTNFDNIVLR